MGFLSSIFGQPPSASLDSVSFDASRYDFQGEKAGSRVWHLPEGGGVGLYFFPSPPDLPVVGSVAELREMYVRRMAEGTEVVDCRVLPLDGVPGIWLIIKGRNAETDGMFYLGSLTIPFRDLSYVIKIQCFETGITGMRETLLMDEALEKGTGRMDDGGFVAVGGWAFDDEKFDEKFPQHPLSTARRELRHIAATLRVDPAVKKAARFKLPRNGIVGE